MPLESAFTYGLVNNAQSLVDERYQARVEMPPMPTGDPWPSIRTVLSAEPRARASESFDADLLSLDSYWADLIRMLQIFFCRDAGRIKELRDSMSFTRYRPYIAFRIDKAPKC
jgi:thymidylate synthase